MTTLTPFRLVIVASVVALLVLGSVAYLLLVTGPNGSPDRAVPLLGFLAPTIVSLLGLAGVAQIGTMQREQHGETTAGIAQLSGKVDGVGQIAAQAALAGGSAAQAGQAAAEAVAAAHPPETQA